ncbi:hypothetical protein K435DRAFT_803591 [Dendrothele bispora CBS 962.96]|uniref:Uncharacterized protein n=1 Tax=Dendrothele bispora (strain CBS 962.96) TaxID=1314807 RepID=A0A4S8LH09_DENBC|nr:hypothetical protein K435DRAFT_803591 [Dendrothele bispora CBS 962.96]
MSEINVAQFLGCSPTLNTAVAPAGKGGQNYKYDLIPGGSNGGVYVNQKLASSLAQNTRQKEPKEYNDKSFLNHTHDHVPAEKHPFCDPFAVVSSRFWIFSRPLMGCSQPSKLSRYNPEEEILKEEENPFTEENPRIFPLSAEPCFRKCGMSCVSLKQILRVIGRDWYMESHQIRTASISQSLFLT